MCIRDRNLPLNFFTPDQVLTPGEYHWSYTTCDENGKPSSSWSRTRSFCIAEDAAETPLPLRDGRLDHVLTSHPRLWMTQERLGDFIKSVEADPTHCTWSTFYEKSVLPWMDKEITREPAGSPIIREPPRFGAKLTLICRRFGTRSAILRSVVKSPATQT